MFPDSDKNFVDVNVEVCLGKEENMKIWDV